MSLDFYLVPLKNKRGHTFDWEYDEPLFHANMTHNVASMWRCAGIYEELYKSDGKLASDIVDKLEAGLRIMEADREGYEKLNPSNGWGSYDGAVRWLRRVIEACRKYPDGIIGVSA